MKRIDLSSGQRRCIKCKETRSLDEFSRRNNRPCGVAARCKECTRTTFKDPERRQQRNRNPDGSRYCPRCKTTKPLTEFWKKKGKRPQTYCKNCLYEYNHARAKANPDLVWERSIKSNYGLTRIEFDRILASQNGVCGICEGEKTGPGRTFRVDHDHATGKIRGLLCQHCNVGLGGARDNPEILRKMIDYLERH